MAVLNQLKTPTLFSAVSLLTHFCHFLVFLYNKKPSEIFLTEGHIFSLF